MYKHLNNLFLMLCLLLLSSIGKSDSLAHQKDKSFDINVIQRPIIFNEKREKLSLEYLKERYGIIQQKAIIQPKLVVVHWTAIDTLEGSFNAFYKPELPSSRTKISSASGLNVSAHYLIDRDGTIYQLLPNTTFARHVIGLNHAAIGIENVGNGSTLPLTERQLQSNISLIKLLRKDYPIEYVIGHYEYKRFIGHPLWKELDPGYLTKKTDPGEIFIKQVREGLLDLNLKVVPNGS